MFNKKLYYTNHARDRMFQYGFAEAEVLYCLNNYDTHYSKPNGRLVYEASLLNGRRIKVYLEEKSSYATVITVTEKGG